MAGDPRRKGMDVLVGWLIVAIASVAAVFTHLPSGLVWLLVLMAVGANAVLLSTMPQWSVELEPATASVVARAAVFSARPSGAPVYAAPAWAVAIATVPRRIWDHVPAVIFPDGGRVPVTPDLAGRIVQLREQSVSGPEIHVPAELVLGRESILLGRVVAAATGAGVGALVAAALGLAFGVPWSLPGSRVAMVVVLVALIANVAAIARSVRPRIRIRAGGEIEVQSTRSGRAVGVPRHLPFLRAIHDPAARVLEWGPGQSIALPPFPAGRDVLAELGAPAIAEAAARLRARLAPALALLDEEEHAHGYREAADPRRAMARLRAIAPEELAWLRRAPDCVFRLLCADVARGHADVLGSLRAEG
jgi:hypothetical protein